MDEQRYNVNLKTLKVLLVMSFISTGSYFISELIGGFALPWMKAYSAAHPEMFPDQWGIMLERSLSIPQWYYFLTAVLDAASIAGLVLMWKLRKNGFHCYTLSKLLLMLLPMLFFDRSYVGAGNIMIGLLFIGWYFYLMRSLGTFNKTDTDGNTDISVKDE